MIFREVYKLTKIKLSECKTVEQRNIVKVIAAVFFFVLGLIFFREILYNFLMLNDIDILFSFFMGFCGIVFILGAIILGATSKEKYYEVQCPNCNHEMLLEKDEVACNCERCQKRIMIVDGYIQGEIFDSEVDN